MKIQKLFNMGTGLLAILIIMGGCGNNKKNNNKMNNNKMNNNYSITLLLTKQLNAGHYASGAGDMMLCDINLSDFKITEEVILDSLERRGFVIPSDLSFLKRIKTIFGFDVKIGELTHLRTMGDDEKIVINQENPFGIGDGYIGVIHIDSDKKIVSKTCYLPDIIDYKSIFPNLAELEKK